MADTVISVLEKLANPVIQEALFLYGVRDEVDWLREELRWMECYLKDAESKRRSGNELAKNWLTEVRDVSHRAEDIIDEFTLVLDRQRSKRGFVGGLKRCAAFPSELIAIHTVGADIKGLREKIQQIKQSRERYGLVDLGDSTAATAATDDALQARRRISPHLDDNTVPVGFDAHKKAISDRLLDPNLRRRCVISIVGTGGLGKTMLANKVYHAKDIKERFEARACLSVSQNYSVREIYEKIVFQMMGKSKAELGNYDAYELRGMLREFLTAKRYLIVLDDVWSTDLWVDLTRSIALPETNNGSRVLLTTRSMNVATSIDSTITPYHLPFLSEDESWTLFLKNVFPYASEGEELTICPVEELEGIGRQLVSRCGGLPLALVDLGGILSTKDPSTVSWMSVVEHLDWGSTNPSGGDCLRILGLSYDNLPHDHLKSCFLYLGVFPKDYEIKAKTLIQLWIAEGLIPQSETQSMEDTARAYLEKLAEMSMIQVVEKEWLGRSASISTFRIHDFFRNLCIREARENGFFAVYNMSNNDYHNNMIRDGKNLRRLAVHGNLKMEVVEGNWFLPLNLRSVLVFGEIDKTYVEQIISRLRLLKVIHFNRIEGITKFPTEIVNLTHLRYLRIRVIDRLSYEGEIPSSIANLCNLQTLDVSDIGPNPLPKSIGQLCTLRHLYLGSRVECLPDVGHLTNLQTLRKIWAGEGWIEQGLEKLVNIRDLKVSGLEADQFRVFLDSLRKIERLSTLSLDDSKAVSVELFGALSNHSHLRLLSLDGPMSQRQLTNGNGFRFPPNLTTLTLMNSKLEHDPMSTLEKLPNLVHLQLQSNAYIGKEMVCGAGGFPRLQELSLARLEGLEEWKVEDRAMPNLISLSIFECRKLSVLPEGVQHLKSLRRLKIKDMSEEFEQRLQQDGGEDWYKIRVEVLMVD